MGKTELEYPYYHQYYYDGDRMIAEVWESEGLFFLYDSTGIIGMQYWYDEELMGTYWFSKNLQGDIVAMYGDDGTLYETYTYDAWGNKTTTRHSSGYSISCPFGYRSYYYDSDLGLYYLQSRYYDSTTGRFISPDKHEVLGVTPTELTDKNLYAYCDNNPVTRVDGDGEFWGEIWGGICNFIGNVFDATFSSVEVELGIGFGIGSNVLDTVTAELSRDTYVGIDDGVLVTGNVITAELSLADSDISIGDTYNHLVEKDGVRVSMSANATHGPFDMINYPDITRGNQLAIGPFVFNNSGDFVICFSGGAHLIFGGHFSIGFNVSEYYRRLFD